MRKQSINMSGLADAVCLQGKSAISELKAQIEKQGHTIVSEDSDSVVYTPSMVYYIVRVRHDECSVYVDHNVIFVTNDRVKAEEFKSWMETGIHERVEKEFLKNKHCSCPYEFWIDQLTDWTELNCAMPIMPEDFVNKHRSNGKIPIDDYSILFDPIYLNHYYPEDVCNEFIGAPIIGFESYKGLEANVQKFHKDFLQFLPEAVKWQTVTETVKELDYVVLKQAIQNTFGN